MKTTCPLPHYFSAISLSLIRGKGGPVKSGLLLAFIGLAALAVPDSSSVRERSVTLSISTDRADYYVGEPVRLRLTVRNESDRAVEGYFQFVSLEGRLVVKYRRVGQAFASFGGRRQRPRTLEGVNVQQAPMKVGARQEGEASAAIAQDWSTGRLVLEQPGDYEFYVECRPWPDDSGAILRSDLALVRVVAAPDSQKDAFAEYVASGLPVIVQAWPFPPLLNHESIAQAAAFLDHHPIGPYSDHVRWALTAGLQHRVLRRRASAEERELYEKLKAERTPAERTPNP
jgi:hypothetical protein